jgi:disulfide bond formation protein DsbB
MLALACFAWLGVIAPTRLTGRAVALVGWLGSAIAGVAVASYHVWLQQAANPLFQPCAPNPDFPTWMPLHEWLPGFFAAGGLCGDIDWSLLGLSMPRWLQLIFAGYALIALVVIALHLWHHRARRKLN